MKIVVNGKQIDVGESLRGRIAERLNADFTKFTLRPIDVVVTVSKDAYMFTADCVVRLPKGIKMQSHGQGNDAYAAFADAAERIEKRLRRYKRRLRDHPHIDHHIDWMDGLDHSPAQYRVVQPESDTHEDDHHANGNGADHAPVIIAEQAHAIPRVTVSEAVMRMDLADSPALMFRNSASGELNVVYRRPDGNIGWIDPATA